MCHWGYHVNVPVHFLALNSRHPLALEVDLWFGLIVGCGAF